MREILKSGQIAELTESGSAQYRAVLTPEEARNLSLPYRGIETSALEGTGRLAYYFGVVNKVLGSPQWIQLDRFAFSEGQYVDGVPANLVELPNGDGSLPTRPSGIK